MCYNEEILVADGFCFDFHRFSMTSCTKPKWPTQSSTPAVIGCWRRPQLTTRWNSGTWETSKTRRASSMSCLMTKLSTQVTLSEERLQRSVVATENSVDKEYSCEEEVKSVIVGLGWEWFLFSLSQLISTHWTAPSYSPQISSTRSASTHPPTGRSLNISSSIHTDNFSISRPSRFVFFPLLVCVF